MTIKQRIPMTVQGIQKLRDELQQLKYVARPKIIDEVATAREYGDLRENAEYQEASKQHGLVEARIAELEFKLSAAELVDISRLANDGRVIFGAVVQVVNKSNGQTAVYQIVGEDEANIDAGKISVTSPVARALIGKYEGEAVTVITPEGETVYEIIHVEYH